MSAEKPEIRISEKDRVNGIQVPNGWGLSRVSDHWYPPGGPWHGYMIAIPIPGTLRVQCKCGWQGTTEDLRDKTCPICGEAFKAYPQPKDKTPWPTTTA